MWSLMMCTAHQILFGDKIEKNEMGGACSAYGGGERRIFEPKMDEVTGEWRNLHNEELNDL